MHGHHHPEWHASRKEMEGEAKKPDTLLNYTSTKIRVHNLDHFVSIFTSRQKANRWSNVFISKGSSLTAFILYSGGLLPTAMILKTTIHFT